MTVPMPNGAGYFPEYEDVPRNLNEEEEIIMPCEKCGGETADKLSGDECVAYCSECNHITYGKENK